MGTLSAGQLRAVRMHTLGTISSPRSPGLLSGRYSSGALFTSASTGYVFASSLETGQALPAVTHDGGATWTHRRAHRRTRATGDAVYPR